MSFVIYDTPAVQPRLWNPTCRVLSLRARSFSRSSSRTTFSTISRSNLHPKNCQKLPNFIRVVTNRKSKSHYRVSTRLVRSTSSKGKRERENSKGSEVKNRKQREALPETGLGWGGGRKEPPGIAQSPFPDYCSRFTSAYSILSLREKRKRSEGWERERERERGGRRTDRPGSKFSWKMAQQWAGWKDRLDLLCRTGTGVGFRGEVKPRQLFNQLSPESFAAMAGPEEPGGGELNVEKEVDYFLQG